MRYGSGSAEIVSLLKSVSYNAVTLLWIFYLKQQDEAIPEMRLAPQLGSPITALADSFPENKDPFISMVEHAVEQVLSRNPWPRPTTDRSRIVGRQPGPGETN